MCVVLIKSKFSLLLITSKFKYCNTNLISKFKVYFKFYSHICMFEFQFTLPTSNGTKKVMSKSIALFRVIPSPPLR
jgi:hypothetical protein